MSRSPALSVRVPKPVDLTFAELMNRLRMWLDYRKIQPASFRTFDDLSVEISFRSEDDASAFKTQFALVNES